MSQLQRSLSFMKREGAAKGDRLFIFDTFKSLQLYLQTAIDYLQSLNIEHSVFGNACIKLPEGNRIIMIVRHSDEWIQYTRGMIYVDWFSNVDLRENEIQELQSRVREK